MPYLCPASRKLAGRFYVRTAGATCGVFFYLSVLYHNCACEVVSAAAVRRSVAWPPPPYLGRHTRNSPCINCQVCARDVFRSQTARPCREALKKANPLFCPIRAKTRENGAFSVSRPARNAGKSRVFRESDRQTGIC